MRKLTGDLKTKVDSIKAERQKIVEALKSLPVIAVQPTFIAKTPPRNWNKSKRPYSVVKQTPTPKTKIKRTCFFLQVADISMYVLLHIKDAFISPNY